MQIDFAAGSMRCEVERRMLIAHEELIARAENKPEMRGEKRQSICW
jgi:hypothetical protein